MEAKPGRFFGANRKKQKFRKGTSKQAGFCFIMAGVRCAFTSRWFILSWRFKGQCVCPVIPLKKLFFFCCFFLLLVWITLSFSDLDLMKCKLIRKRTADDKYPRIMLSIHLPHLSEWQSIPHWQNGSSYRVTNRCAPDKTKNRLPWFYWWCPPSIWVEREKSPLTNTSIHCFTQNINWPWLKGDTGLHFFVYLSPETSSCTPTSG